MKYPKLNEDANKNEAADASLPNWFGKLRMLVFALMIVSIAAMLALIYAAFMIVKSHDEVPLVSNIVLPEGAQAVSLTFLQNGETITVYENGGLFAQHATSDGREISTVAFE